MTEFFSAGKGGSGYGAYISGTGWAVPPRIVTNDQVVTDMIPFLDPPEEANIAAGKPTTAGWVEKSAGVKQRRWMDAGQKLSDLSVMACQRALAAASVTINDVDRIIVGTVTAEDGWPTEANHITHGLGDPKIPGHDVTAACSSFMYALEQAYMAVRSGMSKRVLVVGADRMGYAANPQDRASFMLFGDAVGAVVVERDRPERDCFLYWNVGQDTTGIDLIGSKVVPQAAGYPDPAVSGGLRRVWMDGPRVFETMVPMAVDVAKQALKALGLKPSDIALACPHQANFRITRAWARGVGFTMDQVVSNIDRFGNTTSASVPLALGESWARCEHDRKFRELEPGDPVLLIAFGGGLTWALTVVQWSENHLRPSQVPWVGEAVADLFRLKPIPEPTT